MLPACRIPMKKRVHCSQMKLLLHKRHQIAAVGIKKDRALQILLVDNLVECSEDYRL